MEKIEWDMPHYRQEESMRYVPDEKDLDQLISSAHSKRMAAFLQTLKETWADPGEILRAEWIDLKDNILAINHPVKRHLPGYSPPLSTMLISMLNNLPKDNMRYLQ